MLYDYEIKYYLGFRESFETTRIGRSKKFLSYKQIEKCLKMFGDDININEITIRPYEAKDDK